MTQLLESLFNIRPEEQKKALLMLLYSTCMVAAAFVIARTVASTLFLKRIDPKYLPLTYVASAIFVSLFSMGYAKFGNKLRRDRTIIISFVIFTIVILSLRGLLEIAPHSIWLMGALYVFVEVMGTLAIIQFWTFANDVFTTREAKRLFAFIGAGGAIAAIVFGAIVRSTVKTIGAPNLLFMIAGLFVVCIFVVFQLGRMFLEKLETQQRIEKTYTGEHDSQNLLADFKRLFKSSHLITIAGSLVVISMVVVIVDYQFMITARGSFGDENTLAAFFGTFYIFTGCAAFMLQFFLTSRLLQRYGILFALLFLPGILLLMSVGMLLASGPKWVLGAATGAKGSDNVIRYSINNITFQLLYLPVPAEFRSRAKALIDGIIKPLAIGFSGLMILVLVMFISPQRLSLIVISMIVVWIFFIVRARNQYMLSLADTIRKKKLDLYGSMLPVDDSTVKALEMVLQEGNERDAYNALELLNVVSDKNWDPLVSKLLYSKSPGLRKRAIEYLGRKGNTEYTKALSTFFNDHDPEVRAAAFDAYCMIQEERGMMNIYPFMQDSDPQIKSTVVACMIQYGGIDGILMAADELKTMLESTDWQMRLAGVNVLKKIKVKQFYQPLEKLIHDENISVQIEAIQAAGKMKSPFLLSALVDKLAQQKTSRAAILALSRYGEDILEPLTTILEDIDQEPNVRMHIPKIIRTIGTQQSLDVLMKNVDIKNDKIRNNIIVEMAHMAKSDRHLRFDTEKITSTIETETKNYYQQVVILSEIETKIESHLLGEALNLRAKRAAQRLLVLLSMVHPDQPIDSITLGLRSSDPSIRANSIELLDNILEGEQKRPILAVFEDDTIQKKRKLGQSYFNTLKEDSFVGWLQQLLDDDEHWVVACTIYQVGISRIHELSTHLNQVLTGDNPLLTETARLALNSFIEPEMS